MGFAVRVASSYSLVHVFVSVLGERIGRLPNETKRKSKGPPVSHGGVVSLPMRGIFGGSTESARQHLFRQFKGVRKI